MVQKAIPLVTVMRGFGVKICGPVDLGCRHHHLLVICTFKCAVVCQYPLVASSWEMNFHLSGPGTYYIYLVYW